MVAPQISDYSWAKKMCFAFISDQHDKLKLKYKRNKLPFTTSSVNIRETLNLMVGVGFPSLVKILLSHKARSWKYLTFVFSQLSLIQTRILENKSASHI